MQPRRCSFLTILALLTGLGTAYGTSSPGAEHPPADAVYSTALEMYRAGNFDRARELLLVTLADRPDDARFRELLGFVYRDGLPRRPDEAIAAFRAALRLDASLARVAAALAEELSRSGNPAEAELFLRERVASHPDEARTLRMLGALVQSDGRFEEGEAFLARASETDPSDPMTWFEIGRGKVRSGDPPGAVEALEEARELDSTSAPIRYALSQAYMAAGRTEDAEKELEAFTELDEAEDRIMWERLARDRLQRAISLHEDLLRDDPDAPIGAYSSLVNLYQASGTLEKGRRFFQVLASGRPDAAAPLLAEALLLGNTDDAWGLLKRAIERQPSSTDSLALMADRADSPARREEMRSILTALEAGTTPVEEILVWRGVLDAREGKLEAAEAAFRTVLASHPDHPKAAMNLGLLYVATDRLQEAVDAFRANAEAHPANGPAWYNLALTEARLGALDAARTHLGRAMAAGDRRAPVVLLLARILIRLGEREEAVSLLRQSLDSNPEQPELLRLLRSLAHQP